MSIPSVPPAGPEPAGGSSSAADAPTGPYVPPAADPGLNGDGAASAPAARADGFGPAPAAEEAGPVEPDIAAPAPAPADTNDSEDGGPRRGRKKSALRTVVEWVLVLGGALGAALIIQAVFLKAFYIPSGSMEPTLAVDDRVLVNKLSYDFGPVQRGDIIVFHKPPDAPESDVNDFIKRVVAIEGDTIEAREGVVFVNGQPLHESYLAPGTATLNLPQQEVPADHVFVMGDNRAHSVDSRVFGPIAEGSIVGEAIFRVWPVADLGRV